MYIFQKKKFYDYLKAFFLFNYVSRFYGNPYTNHPITVAYGANTVKLKAYVDFHYERVVWDSVLGMKTIVFQNLFNHSVYVDLNENMPSKTFY